MPSNTDNGHAYTHDSPLRPSINVHKNGTPMTPSASTPLVTHRAVHQPSPNRTEAAAAMMHLFASSTTLSPASVNAASDTSKATCQAQKRLPVHPPLPGAVKAKRKYVRKAPRKPSAAAKKLSTFSDDTKVVTPVKAQNQRVSSSEDGAELDMDEDPGDKMMKDESQNEDIRFFPFREYNRKEKSLGLLCENFLNLYRSNHISEICLDRAAVELGVERRRIYDIVNILESIHLVSRKSKNLYNWHGLSALPVSVAAMRRKYAEAGPSSYEFNAKERRRGKSLSKLSQMFVQLFLVKEHCVIPLDQAAKQLIQLKLDENEEDRLLKTKIRRLYDVANVLVSVGLIEKLQLSNSRKPVFRWKTNPATATNAISPVNSQPIHIENMKMEVPQAPSITRTSSIDEAEIVKTSQSCDDSDDSDNCTHAMERTIMPDIKRKRCSDSTSLTDDDLEENPLKKSKSIEGSPPTKQPSLLRFDQQQLPIHPQLILQDQQHAVRQFMEQYVREYVDYLILQQAPLATNSLTSTTSNLSYSTYERDIVESLKNDIHRTPVQQLSSITNRVSDDLVGSINNSLFCNTTSPQSVADFFYSSEVGRTEMPHAEMLVNAGKSDAKVSMSTTQSSANDEIERRKK